MNKIVLTTAIFDRLMCVFLHQIVRRRGYKLILNRKRSFKKVSKRKCCPYQENDNADMSDLKNKKKMVGLV